MAILNIAFKAVAARSAERDAAEKEVHECEERLHEMRDKYFAADHDFQQIKDILESLHDALGRSEFEDASLDAHTIALLTMSQPDDFTDGRDSDSTDLSSTDSEGGHG